MKKLFFFALSLFFAASMQAEVVKDTLAYDRFDRTELGAQYTATSNISLDKGKIKLACPKNSTNSKNFASADNLATKALDSMQVDSIVWTVGMRQNYNATALSGFASGKRGVATMLAGTSNSALDAGNGYAIIMGGTIAPSTFHLVSFKDGFGSDEAFKDIVAGSTLNNIREWCTFRLVYVPATKTWSLYQVSRDYNDAAEFYDPDQVTEWTLAGSAKDSTNTSVVLSKYGFMQNYTGTQAFNFWATYFSMIAYTHIDIPSTLATPAENKQATKVMINGKMMILRNGVSYSVLGTPER